MSRTSERPSRDGDEGSALVEFTLVAAILTVLTLAVLQLGVAVYVRAVLLDAASSGARAGSRAELDPRAAEATAVRVATASLGSDSVDGVEVHDASVAGRPAIRVTLAAPFPVLGLIGPAGSLRVEGTALLETTGARP